MDAFFALMLFTIFSCFSGFLFLFAGKCIDLRMFEKSGCLKTTCSKRALLLAEFGIIATTLFLTGVLAVVAAVLVNNNSDIDPFVCLYLTPFATVLISIFVIYFIEKKLLNDSFNKTFLLNKYLITNIILAESCIFLRHVLYDFGWYVLNLGMHIESLVNWTFTAVLTFVIFIVLKIILSKRALKKALNRAETAEELLDSESLNS